MIEILPAIKRARIEQLNIYEVSEDELVQLERGSPESLFLNFAIFFISSALSLLVAILTTTFSSLYVFTTFVVLSTIGFAAGVVLLGLWLWHRRSRAAIFFDIRRRMPPDGIPVTTANP